MDRSEYRREYYYKNKEKVKLEHKQHYQNNKEKYKIYVTSKYKQKYLDPIYRLKCILRSNLYIALGKGRSKRVEEILGCNIEEFKLHLESQFQPWMNWNNQAGHIIPGPNLVWDVDHILPLAGAQTEEDVYRLHHYTNFQPLCAHYNRFIKRDN
jgi:hypothetical protein